MNEYTIGIFCPCCGEETETKIIEPENENKGKYGLFIAECRKCDWHIVHEYKIDWKHRKLTNFSWYNKNTTKEKTPTIILRNIIGEGEIRIYIDNEHQVDIWLSDNYIIDNRLSDGILYAINITGKVLLEKYNTKVDAKSWGYIYLINDKGITNEIIYAFIDSLKSGYDEWRRNNEKRR